MQRMCCIILDAGIILDNMFGSPECPSEFREGSIDRAVIDRCSVFVANNLPGDVVCDLSDGAIRKAMEDGHFVYDPEKKEFILKSEGDTEKYKLFYPDSVTSKLGKIIDCFWKRKLYGRNILPVKTLVG